MAAKEVGYSSSSDGTRLLKNPEIKKYIKKRVKKSEKDLQVTFDWKIQKLRDVVLNANLDDITPSHFLTAIAELNKMQGHYSPERHENVNANITVDPSVLKVRAILEDLKKKYEKEY